MRFIAVALAVLSGFFASGAAAQQCPDKTLMYWLGFPAGGEADMSARHQQLVLKKKCPKVETVVQYKPGAGGGLLWSQVNALPADGANIYGVVLPHIVVQPLEGVVQYKTDDLTPVYWFRYMPDAIVVPASSPIKTFQDLIKLAKSKPKEVTLGGSGTNSANHIAHERLAMLTGIQTTYVPFKGTGDLTTAVLGGQTTGAVAYSALAVSNPGKVRALAVAMPQRDPKLPDVPTFKELGYDWVDGGYGGIGMPKSTTMEQRKRVSDLFAMLNADPEMKVLAEKAGFELIDIPVEKADAFLKSRIGQYTQIAQRLGLGVKK